MKSSTSTTASIAPGATVTPAELEGLHFTDVTAAAGLDSPQSNRPLSNGDSMTGGVAACDLFGNGRTDLYVTRVGLPNELFRNNGDGTFTDVASAAGVQGNDASPGYAGVTCGDLNGDGLPDLYVTGAGTNGNVLYLNNGDGTFSDDTAAAGLQLPPADPSISALMYGSAIGDFDHDGRLDLVTVQWDVRFLMVAGKTAVGAEGGLGRPVGTEPPNASGSGSGSGGARGAGGGAASGNGSGSGGARGAGGGAASGNGSGKGSGGSKGAGAYGGFGGSVQGGACAAARIRASHPIAYADPNRSRLYRNHGNGPGGVPHFSDVTASMGMDFKDLLGFTPTFIDLTGNGWDDLVVASDSCTSQVYLNNSGTHFENVTSTSHANSAENGMGSAFADFSGNGLPDWFETSIYYPGACPTANSLVGCSGNRMYVNVGGGKFADRTDAYGVRDGGWGWGAVAGDFANGGTTSILQVDGMLWSPDEVVKANANRLYAYYRYFSEGSPRLWLNVGRKPFAEVARQVGLTAQGQEKAVVPIDVMNDGKIGVFITDTGSTPVLYRNDTSNGNGWVTIRLHDGTTANRFGVGAKVRIRATPGARPQEQELLDSGSYESSNPLELHFGLGSGVTNVDEIDVYWPGSSQPQVLRNVAADRYVDITRG